MIPLSDAAVAAATNGEVLIGKLGVGGRRALGEHKASPYFVASDGSADAAYELARHYTEDLTTAPDGSTCVRFSGPSYVLLLGHDQLTTLGGSHDIIKVEARDGKTREVVDTMLLSRTTWLELKTEFGELGARAALVSEIREGDHFSLSGVWRSGDVYYVFRAACDFGSDCWFSYSRGTRPGFDWPDGIPTPANAFSDEGNGIPRTALALVIDQRLNMGEQR